MIFRLLFMWYCISVYYIKNQFFKWMFLRMNWFKKSAACNRIRLGLYKYIALLCSFLLDNLPKLWSFQQEKMWVDKERWLINCSHSQLMFTWFTGAAIWAESSKRSLGFTLNGNLKQSIFFDNSCAVKNVKSY